MDPLLLKSLEKLMADGCEDYTLTINPISSDFFYDTFILKTKTLLLKKTKKLYDKYTLELVSDECEDDEYLITIKTMHKHINKSKIRDIFVIVLDDGKEFGIDPKDYEIDDDTDSVIFNIEEIENIEDNEDNENKKSAIDYLGTSLDKEEDDDFVNIDYDIELDDLTAREEEEEE